MTKKRLQIERPNDDKKAVWRGLPIIKHDETLDTRQRQFSGLLARLDPERRALADYAFRHGQDVHLEVTLPATRDYYRDWAIFAACIKSMVSIIGCSNSPETRQMLKEEIGSFYKYAKQLQMTIDRINADMRIPAYIDLEGFNHIAAAFELAKAAEDAYKAEKDAAWAELRALVKALNIMDDGEAYAAVKPRGRKRDEVLDRIAPVIHNLWAAEGKSYAEAVNMALVCFSQVQDTEAVERLKQENNRKQFGIDMVKRHENANSSK